MARFENYQQAYQLERIFLPRALHLLTELCNEDPKLAADITKAVERAIERTKRKKDPPA